MKIVISVIFCLVILSSCLTTLPRYLYAPAPQNIPLLNNKGDSKAGLNYSDYPGEGEESPYSSNAINVSTAYAFSDKFAVQGNYFSGKEKAGDVSQPTGQLIYKRHLIEMGVGYFKPLGAARKRSIQIFAGAGFGKTQIKDLPDNLFYHANVFKIYLQPALILGNLKKFSFAFSSRFNWISFHKIETSYDPEQINSYKLSGAQDGEVFIEPGMTISFAVKPGIRLEIQNIYSAALNNKNTLFEYRKTCSSIGVFFDFNKPPFKVIK